MSGKKKIALYQQILAGKQVRGPHVFFPLFHAEYQKAQNTEFELFYIVKTDNSEKLKQQYPTRELDVKNVIFLPEHNSRFKKVLEIKDLCLVLIKHRISLLHVISFTLNDPIHQLLFLQKLRVIWPVKITMSITYNGFPRAFESGYTGRFAKYLAYDKLFRAVRFDGIYSWFENVIHWVETSGIFSNAPIAKAVESRFCDVEKFHPEKKEKIIVWAGAIVSYKRPQMFINALVNIKSSAPELLNGWKVIFIGDGELTEEIRRSIDDNGLSDFVEMRPSSNTYHELINKSMVHVSTQELDHFPNLVINEAMASGCAIIATNVGRAYLFVKDGKNGYLTPTDDEQGLTQSLERFLSQSPEVWDEMMKYSRKMCETEHTPASFIKGIDAFWKQVLERKN